MIIGKNIHKTFVKNQKSKKKNSKRPLEHENFGILTEVAEEKHLGRTKIEFFALRDVSLQANDGEILGILGPNGAGKTTLLRILGNIMMPTQGIVEIMDPQGSIAKNQQEAKQIIGYLSANTKLFQRMTPRELLIFVGNLYGFEKEHSKERAQEIIDLLDMEDFDDNKIDRLSTGQLQRTNIARCLLHDPPNYIFDEPTLGLDVISSSTIMEFMKKERNRGKAIIYSTHYMEEAEYLCDRVLMIHHGQIIASGSPQEVKSLTGTNNLRDAFISLIQHQEVL